MIGPLLAIAGVVIVGPLVAYAISHNRLVSDRGEVADAWAVIDVELQRRHQLIPPLVESVRAAATHERDMLERLADARRAADQLVTPGSRSTGEEFVDQAIRAVVALRERYPALNSQANFLALQHELTLTEDRVAAARRFYNTRVANLNRRIDAFPSSIVARRHRVAKAEFYGD